ncbi:ATP-binding protein [Oceanobacillus sojae]|uniref:ATP-binding protein n=1 Tax=Oceanobacillus sojae TaxID=582851 RepID=UPI0036333E8A
MTEKKHHQPHHFHKNWKQNSEESINRQVIANLSHDVRTPLTIMRRHVFQLGNECLSVKGIASLKKIDHQILEISDWMEDLLTYTMITSGKYPYHPTTTDMVRLVRNFAANWYPQFEKESFRIDVDLPDEKTFYWKIDPKWITRMFNYLFQNILRHAVKGTYVGITVDVKQERIIVMDKELDMKGSSYDSAADIGFLISNYMLQKMKLQAHFSSSDKGTIVEICKSEKEMKEESFQHSST